ncbi:hypothetical protein M501DRAFT_1034588 [Patellaria atrata CBS 101060]|uniref:RING-type domain-containing protein n=1 Tax=Patellaria atrata CBS 101060 TaxID=1346257 RepID=A0A9P4VPF9_9PEZI|nr:hypothetical protein M501DRAFT_1034588 [Patellaria atrata CBS 101060]
MVATHVDVRAGHHSNSRGLGFWERIFWKNDRNDVCQRDNINTIDSSPANSDSHVDGNVVNKETSEPEICSPLKEPDMPTRELPPLYGPLNKDTQDCPMCQWPLRLQDPTGDDAAVQLPGPCDHIICSHCVGSWRLLLAKSDDSLSTPTCPICPASKVIASIFVPPTAQDYQVHIGLLLGVLDDLYGGRLNDLDTRVVDHPESLSVVHFVDVWTTAIAEDIEQILSVRDFLNYMYIGFKRLVWRYHPDDQTLLPKYHEWYETVEELWLLQVEEAVEGLNGPEVALIEIARRVREAKCASEDGATGGSIVGNLLGWLNV